MEDMQSTGILFDIVNATRLASKGDMVPHYTSTRGTTLFKTHKGEPDGGSAGSSSFFFLLWTNWHNERSEIIPCKEEEAFRFLYDLYGSRYTDTTDEDLDEILNEHFPNRTIAGTDNYEE